MRKIGVLMAFLIGVSFFHISKAEVMGFLDGNMYDPSTGTWQCLFLMDGNCYDNNQNIVTTRPAGYIPPVTTIPASNPQTIYVPLYVSPDTTQDVPTKLTQTPVIVDTPIATVSETTLLPAYTEDEWRLKDIWCTALNQTTIGCYASSYPIPSNAQIIYQLSNGQHDTLTWESNTWNTPRLTYGNLTPDTNYDYTVTYKEAGRDDATFHKSVKTLK